jgi:hypothetical protein
MLAVMFLLVTGASGAGKSTVRRAVAPRLGDAIDCVELGDVVEVPSVPTIAWRQRATEAVVRRALELQAEDRHLLLSGDPVAPPGVRGLDARSDPSHMPEVLTTNGWEEMRCERWTGDEGRIGPWTIEVIDTSNLAVEQVVTQILGWCRRALARNVPGRVV